jgi:protein-disulfide isomerase
MDNAYNPLVSRPFHVGSGKMALIALFAQTKGFFWKINDLLFKIASQKKDFNLKQISQIMNIPTREIALSLNQKYLRQKLKHDIAIGLKLDLKGTPGFVVAGHVYTGTLPVDLLAGLQR